jgi:penicillin G amidase
MHADGGAIRGYTIGDGRTMGGEQVMKLGMMALLASAAVVAAPQAVAQVRDAQKVTISRDKSGVPHVMSDDPVSLFYGVGRAMAQDRLAQLELARRAGRGELAEIMGPSMVEADKQARARFGSEAALTAEWKAWKFADHKKMIVAYVAGINSVIDEANAAPDTKLPYEYKQWGIAPRRWTINDFVGTNKVLMRAYGSVGGRELLNQSFLNDMVKRYGEAEAQRIFDDVLPVNDPSAKPLIAGDAPPPARLSKADGAPAPAAPMSADALRQYAATVTGFQTTARLAGVPLGASRSIVIGPKKSANGHIYMLQSTADGPDIHIHGAGYDAAGYTILPSPVPIMGRGPAFGYILTTGETDMIDLFAETLDPANKYRYRFNGAWRDMEVVKETIKVRGAAPVTVDIARTVHGPVMSWDEKRGFAYSEKNALDGRWLDGASFFFEIGRAHDFAAFEKAVALMSPSSNILYGGEDGVIALWHGGADPIRADGVDPRLPTPGDGTKEWKGNKTYAQFPKIINPSDNYFHVWNNKAAEDAYYGDTSRYGETFRTYLGHEIISGMSNVTLDSMRDLNRQIGMSTGGADLAATSPRFFTPYLRTAAAGDQRLTELVHRMERWNRLYEDLDGNGTYDDPGLAIYRAWYQHAQEMIVGKQIGEWWHKIDDNSYIKYRSEVLNRIIKGKDAKLPMKHDWFGAQGRDAVLKQTLLATAAELEKTYKTPDMQRWLHPVFWRFYNPAEAKKSPGLPSFQDEDNIIGTTAGRLGLIPGKIRDNGSENWNALMEISPQTKAFLDVTRSGGQNQFINTAGQGNPHIGDQVDTHVSFQFKEVPMTDAEIAAAQTAVEVVTVPAEARKPH